MAQVYQTKINRILGDGARATKFAITGFDDPFNTDKEHYLILKTAQFPGKFHDVIELKFKGRTIPIKGQTRYDNTFTCTFYLDETHELRSMFMNWIEALDQKHNMQQLQHEKVIDAKNKHSSVGNYTSTLIMTQVNFDDDTEETANYKLYNVFPKSVSSIELDYSNVGNIIEYTVEFSYSHFDFYSKNQLPGNFVDELRSNFLNQINYTVGTIKKNITSILTSAISSAKSGFISNFNSNDVSSSIIPSIGKSISSSASAIYKRSGDIFKDVDFDPKKFLDI